MRARRLTFLAACALAACATDEASGPATPLTLPPGSDVPEASLPPPPSNSTPGTNPPPTSTTTIPATTTTEVPGPKDPTAKTVALFGGLAGDTTQPWVPLGGWDGTKFVGPAARTAPEWIQGADIRTSALDRKVIGAEIGANADACSGRDGPAIAVPVAPPRPPGEGLGMLAVEGKWALRPHPVVTVDASIPAYVAAAHELLGSRIPRTAEGAIRQIVLADFDGDDAETSIVVYESINAPARDGSGFTIVFAVETATGAVHELTSSVVASPPRATTTTTTTTSSARPDLERFRVLDVADLNGDRIMELAIRAWTPDRTSIELYTLKGSTFRRALGAGCRR